MSSGCRLLWIGLILLPAAMGAELRICADPNNLPFSNQRQEGFDNKIAQLAAQDLGRTARFVWVPERGSFVKESLLANRCDVLMGMPAGYPDAAVTQPYYRSTYVFLWRRGRGLNIRSLNDPGLRKLRIGVHVVSDDASNLPPAQALANRGMQRNIAAYTLYGDMSKPNPPAALIDAVARGDIDVAIAWGPLAGYFAKRSHASLEIAPVSPAVDRLVPFTFSISMGVRPEQRGLLRQLNRVIERRRAVIRRILADYGVPLMNSGPATAPVVASAKRP